MVVVGAARVAAASTVKRHCADICWPLTVTTELQMSLVAEINAALRDGIGEAVGGGIA
eukprot:COSAG02_NODE_18604_length_929_cov_12.850602_1_plen_57_part_10